MSALDKNLRNALEKTVKSARGVAETAARAAVDQLGVGHDKPEAFLSDAEKALRNRLRTHGKQLGDARDSKSANPTYGKQEVQHLVQEVAYQHWHRMLFARFLADNNLLMYDGVAVTIEECDELAPDEGAKSGWELAGRLAARMLPQIFRSDSPVYELSLPQEHQHKLENLLADLPQAMFLASDSLGWVYQFWQADNKDQINKSGVKIGADELPAVTQLFTEDYMVDFLLDNTLGAWHAGKVLATNPKLAENAQSEDELRQAVALAGCPWSYLRFVKVARPSRSGFSEEPDRDGLATWTPAAGTFDGWPTSAAALRALDPCMGSGHFVVAMFERLVTLRLAEENLDEPSAVAAVIRDNLFGLEIDPRCTQIAAFNLALAAWRRVGHCQLPVLNLACSGLAPNTREADWLAMAGDDEKLRNGMERLYRLFQKAAVLGSLINPRAGDGDLLEAGFHELQPLLEKALAQEAQDDTAHEMAVTAHGLAKAAEILAGRFTLVATNVPYLLARKQCSTLKEWCDSYHTDAKADLATAFVQRGLAFAVAGGSIALVTPQNWLYLGSSKKLREALLIDALWNVVARLGTGAFETIGGEVVNVALLAITNQLPTVVAQLVGLDAAEEESPAGKGVALREKPLIIIPQRAQLENPDARILVGEGSSLPLLEKYSIALNGMHGGDAQRFRFFFWEVGDWQTWTPFQGTCESTMPYTGRGHVFFWPEDGKIHHENPQAFVKGYAAWGKQGVVVNMMGQLPASLYSGEKFDISCTPIIPHNADHLPAIWAFCSSLDFSLSVRKIDQSLKVTNGTLAKVPFDLAHWQKVAAEKYPDGLPKPFSSDPTQWLFDGKVTRASRSGEVARPSRSGFENNPDWDGLATDGLATLQVAVARLLGYLWPRQTGSSFPDCPALGPDGLERHADQDGIVCIPPVGRESPASDRLLNLLAAAYGETWSNDTLSQLLAGADHAGKSLETWLRDKFFIQHCKLFHHRPFVWHIWDGLHDGFAALINYHKLDYKALESLIYSYLGDWISRQKQDIANGVDGAQERLAAAEVLKKRLELILEGEAPYDIFVRWKPLEQQPIGWHPDLNDGVRMNIRPFFSVPDVGKKGAGVLRDRPNIKWDKDRGKDVPSAPWYELGLRYGGKVGDRINDHHLTLAEKRAAREDSHAQ